MPLLKCIPKTKTQNIYKNTTIIFVGKLVAAHGYRQKRENKLEIKK
jgi:hypothetical protein